MYHKSSQDLKIKKNNGEGLFLGSLCITLSQVRCSIAGLGNYKYRHPMFKPPKGLAKGKKPCLQVRGV